MVNATFGCPFAVWLFLVRAAANGFDLLSLPRWPFLALALALTISGSRWWRGCFWISFLGWLFLALAAGAAVSVSRFWGGCWVSLLGWLFLVALLRWLFVARVAGLAVSGSGRWRGGFWPPRMGCCFWLARLGWLQVLLNEHTNRLKSIYTREFGRSGR